MGKTHRSGTCKLVPSKGVMQGAEMTVTASKAVRINYPAVALVGYEDWAWTTALGLEPGCKDKRGAGA